VVNPVPSATSQGAYLAGVIEGFYGCAWSWSARESTIDFLRQRGLGAYVYAPKSDPFLRRRWAEPWPSATFAQLQQLGRRCRAAGIAWGVGWSPFEVYRCYGPSSRASIRDKLAELNELEPDILCVLFDDMRGDLPELAALQLAIVHDIAAASRARRHIFCPTYYSEDGVLEKVFGAMPRGYWTELGSGLDPAIDYFWTGDRVCSHSYSRQSVAAITAAMGRPPVLWDNYPVNDGARMSRFLHLLPFQGRPGHGDDWVRGHLVNPMNQAWLSRIALCTLEGSGVPAAASFDEAVGTVCAGRLGELLQRDVALFTQGGLDAIAGSAGAALRREYGAIDHPCAREVVAWLSGQYQFDPACLTD
jgi:hyaluronoglucosaminidase